MFFKFARVVTGLAFLALLSAKGECAAEEVVSSKAVPRTVTDITSLLEQYQPDPQKVLELRQILNSSPPETDSKKDLAKHYMKKADAADVLGAFTISIENLRKVVELGEPPFLDRR